MAVTYYEERLAPRVTRRPRISRRIRILIADILLFSVAVGIAISVLYDPRYNLGRSVFVNKTAELVFTVAGHKYQVRSPKVPLTQQETDAYWYYVSYRGYPVYAADGPMAVDP